MVAAAVYGLPLRGCGTAYIEVEPPEDVTVGSILEVRTPRGRPCQSKRQCHNFHPTI